MLAMFDDVWNEGMMFGMEGEYNTQKAPYTSTAYKHFQTIYQNKMSF